MDVFGYDNKKYIILPIITIFPKLFSVFKKIQNRYKTWIVNIPQPQLQPLPCKKNHQKPSLKICTSLSKKFPNQKPNHNCSKNPFLSPFFEKINKNSISIILQKKREKKKEKIKPTPPKCVSRLSRRISRRRSINRKRLLARHVRSVQRTGQRMERPISRYRFDETSKTAMRFIAVEVDPRQRRRGSFFIIPR